MEERGGSGGEEVVVLVLRRHSRVLGPRRCSRVLGPRRRSHVLGPCRRSRVLGSCCHSRVLVLGPRRVVVRRVRLSFVVVWLVVFGSWWLWLPLRRRCLLSWLRVSLTRDGVVSSLSRVVGGAGPPLPFVGGVLGPRRWSCPCIVVWGWCAVVAVCGCWWVRLCRRGWGGSP